MYHLQSTNAFMTSNKVFLYFDIKTFPQTQCVLLRQALQNYSVLSKSEELILFEISSYVTVGQTVTVSLYSRCLVIHREFRKQFGSSVCQRSVFRERRSPFGRVDLLERDCDVGVLLG